jgi:hemin uptake protein HemP
MKGFWPGVKGGGDGIRRDKARLSAGWLRYQIRIIIIRTTQPFRDPTMHTQPALRTTSSSTSILPVAASPAHMQLDSAELLQGQKAVTIVHNGSTYRLQATKLGKLILTK